MRHPVLASVAVTVALLLGPVPPTEGGGGGPSNFCPPINTLDGPRFSGYVVIEQLADKRREEVRVTLIATGQRSAKVTVTHIFRRTYFARDIFQKNETVANVSQKRLEAIVALQTSAPSPQHQGFCLESRGKELFLTGGWAFLTSIDGLTRGATFASEEGPTLFRLARVSGIVVPTRNLGL